MLIDDESVVFVLVIIDVEVMLLLNVDWPDTVRLFITEILPPTVKFFDVAMPPAEIRAPVVAEDVSVVDVMRRVPGKVAVFDTVR